MQTSPPPPPPPIPPHLTHSNPAPLPLPSPNPTSNTAPPPNQPFTPHHLFTYGTLRDPAVLQTLLNLPSLPTLRPASIKGFKMQMWGIYPALLPDTDAEVVVYGSLYSVETEEHWGRLVEYEGVAYGWCECVAALLDEGEDVEGCRMFCWAGDEASAELEEGSFDVERWKRYFRGSVVRDR